MYMTPGALSSKKATKDYFQKFSRRDLGRLQSAAAPGRPDQPLKPVSAKHGLV
jgi:hypothetical protein